MGSEVQEKIKRSVMKFLKPFMDALDALFLHGFDVDFIYGPSLISEQVSQVSGKVNIEAILMLVIRYRLCKIGKLKLFGRFDCRHC